MRMLAENWPNDPIDVLIGDWMSEANMTARAVSKIGKISPSHQRKGQVQPFSDDGEAYEPTFLEALDPALPYIAKHGIKVAVNAGASDTKQLHEVVQKMVKEKGLSLKVAWISGDEVFPAVQKAQASKESKFENICTGELLDEWKFEPLYAQAYLGGLGIAAALDKGMDVVVCGRVSDASLAIGASAWWHGWARSDLECLANALVAGHLIECSNYVCGGNYTGFKALEGRGWDDIGYPIAEISKDGQVIITKNTNSGGEVSVNTCSSQLLYEIQGPWYFNSDVTAILNGLWFEQLSSDRVKLCGVRFGPPPPTTKIGLTARGGYQAEVHWFLVGLDIDAKARMMEAQIRKLLAPHIRRFTKLEFFRYGTCPDNPEDQNSATVDLRILAQAKEMADLAPEKFLRPCLDPVMEGYPGATPHLDLRLALPKPIYEYYVTLLPQSSIQHMVNLSDGSSFEVPPPTAEETSVYPAQQPSQASTEGPASLGGFGRTVQGPLGWIVHGRSGDKGSNANVGFWVRHKDEWDWLRSLLSTDTIKTLLAKEYNGKKIVSLHHLRVGCNALTLSQDRFELPSLRGVHFLLHDHLDRGVSCSSTYDVLGKNVAGK